MDAFRKNAGILLRILLLAVISAILGVLKPSFSSQGVADAAGMVSYLLIIAILAQLLYSVVGVARDAIDAMSGVISAVFPILLLLLTAMGGRDVYKRQAWRCMRSLGLVPNATKTLCPAFVSAWSQASICPENSACASRIPSV